MTKILLPAPYADKPVSGNVVGMSRIHFENGYWLVQILSTITGGWITHGCWTTRQAADKDMRNWR